MFSRNRRLLGVVLGGVLLLGMACSSTDSGPAAPSDGAPEAIAMSPTTVAGGSGGLVPTLLSSVNLLTCRPLPYASSVATVGPNGGTIRVGQTSLVIPQGALASRVTIKAEQISGSTNSVRFSPEGLRFARSAQLTMSYGNCLVTLPTKRIVYTNESLRVLELLKSLDLRLRSNVSAPIDHFSRYAVAY
jgi:hypothetical protein